MSIIYSTSLSLSLELWVLARFDLVLEEKGEGGIGCSIIWLMEPRVGNKFRLGRKIGSGSFGEIYLGLFFRFWGINLLFEFDIFLDLVNCWVSFDLVCRYQYSDEWRSCYQACEYFNKGSSFLNLDTLFGWIVCFLLLIADFLYHAICSGKYQDKTSSIIVWVKVVQIASRRK